MAFPPVHALVPSFLGLVPLTLWLMARAPGAGGRRSAVRGTMLFGAVYFGLLFYWILIALLWFSKLAILAFAGTLGVLILMSGAFGWTLHHAVTTLRVPVWFALPVCWTALEWSRAHLPSTIAFPWLGLGTSLTGFPELVGIAEIVGSRGVTFWLVLINGLLAAAVWKRRRQARWREYALAIALVVVLPMGWGIWRAQTLDVRRAGRVAVLQPNIPEHIKLDPAVSLDSTLLSMNRLLLEIERDTTEFGLIVLPEVVLRSFPELSQFRAEAVLLQSYSQRVDTPIVFGALGVEGGGDRSLVPYNSAFVMTPYGLMDYRYDKRHLVPFVERVPFLPSSWFESVNLFGGYGVGEGLPLIEVEDTSYGVLICYESSYPEAARAFRRAGADVLLNITNDAWYGREPLYARTTALWQHPAHMVMRAIENRVGVARAANTGISMFVDPVGRIYNPTNLFEADQRVDDVWTSDVMTLYARFGDLAGNGAAITALLFVVVSVGRTRRAGSLDPLGPRV